MATTTTGSRFWLDENMFYQPTTTKGKADDIIKMASVKRSIANFVKIVTGQDIKVKYSVKDTSKTNGKQVLLGSDCIKEKNFDAAVGLALHEGSHIKLTDFTICKQLNTQVGGLIPTELLLYMLRKYAADKIDDQRTIDNMSILLGNRIFCILNLLEDRRIDHYIYSTSPGYRVYYKAMYKKYCESPLIDEGLKSGSFREESWDAYQFRIYNLTNVNTDLDALKNLRTIFQLIDLNHINRFKETKELVPLAIQIYTLIEEHIPAPKPPEPEPEKDKEDEEDEKDNDSDSAYILGYTAKGLPNGIIIRNTGEITGHTFSTAEHKVIITRHMSDGAKMRRRLLIQPK